jgi:hypothetical protein
LLNQEKIIFGGDNFSVGTGVAKASHECQTQPGRLDSFCPPERAKQLRAPRLLGRSAVQTPTNHEKN